MNSTVGELKNWLINNSINLLNKNIAKLVKGCFSKNQIVSKMLNNFCF